MAASYASNASWCRPIERSVSARPVLATTSSGCATTAASYAATPLGVAPTSGASPRGRSPRPQRCQKQSPAHRPPAPAANVRCPERLSVLAPSPAVFGKHRNSEIRKLQLERAKADLLGLHGKAAERLAGVLLARPGDLLPNERVDVASDSVEPAGFHGLDDGDLDPIDPFEFLLPVHPPTPALATASRCFLLVPGSRSACIRLAAAGRFSGRLRDHVSSRVQMSRICRWFGSN